MPVITSVKTKKNKSIIDIHFDNGSKLSVDIETFVKLKLKVGEVLSSDDIDKIKKESEFQTVYDKILRFTSLRPRSKKEIEFWLNKHRIQKNLHNELFNRLKRLDLLNDKKFAIWWVDQRNTFRPKPRKILEQELIIKGIDKEIINEVLNELGIDEILSAKRILESKEYLWKDLFGFQKRVKMSNFLQRKGFSWDVIRRVVAKFDQEV